MSGVVAVTTINTSRKETVAYPTIERLMIHKFCVMNLQKLLESHEVL